MTAPKRKWAPLVRTHVGCWLVLGCLSCSGLAIQETDSAGVKIAKGMLRIPLGVATLGVSELQYAVDRDMNSWIGRSEGELMLRWGVPSQTIPDGVGGRLLIWTDRRSFVSPGYSTTNVYGSATAHTYGDTTYVSGNAQARTTYMPPQVYQWEVYRAFRIDSDGSVIAYSWKGL